MERRREENAAISRQTPQCRLETKVQQRGSRQKNLPRNLERSREPKTFVIEGAR